MDQLLEENPPEQSPADEREGRKKPRILVAPLDWGLGHATRCIPIIRALLQLGCDPWLAGEGAQELLLKKEFPDLRFLSLEGYRIRYAKTRTGLLRSILFQVPSILKAIKKENTWLKQKTEEFGFDAVISDNRYGLYHSTIPCIFITHQLTIKSPFGKWVEKLLQKRNYRYINRFTACWVPDIKGIDNLAGELSHPSSLPPVAMHYIGWLSRFEIKDTEEIKDHLLVILSGPEPQRSIFEEKIINEISRYNGTATIVRGLPQATTVLPSTNMLRFYNHLTAEELNKEMLEAEYIIARSGYSTIMDLVKLQKKSILIATPGQTEQEWLAGYLLQKKIAFCTPQKGFSLSSALENAKQFNYHIPFFNNEVLLQQTIADFISAIKK